MKKNKKADRQNNSENQKKNQGRIIANNLYIIKLAWEISPKRVIADIIMNAFDYFSRVFYSVIFIKYLFGAIEAHKSFSAIILFVFATVVVFASTELFTVWYKNRFKPLTDNVINAKLNKMLFEKATEVELACFEDTDFYNTYMLAIKEADTRITSVLNNIFGVLFGAIAAISVLLAMYSIDRFVILFLVSPLLGNFVFGKVANKIAYNRDIDGVVYRRKMDYVNRVVYLQTFAKEIRLSNVFNVLKNIYENGYGGLMDVINKYKVKSTVSRFIADIATFTIIFEGVLLYGSYRALVSKTIMLSDFAILASAMVSATWILIGLSGNIANTFKDGLYIENLRKFLDYKPVISENQDGIIPHNEIESIEFRNVSFTYKGQKDSVIKNINFKISGREKIALVGHNGAGKTTFIKLLMRLYDPTGGEILVNNENIRNYNVKEYRKLFGTAFQDYQIFSMTVAENVLMKELEDMVERETALKALEKSGVYEKVLSMHSTIDTVLTREFDDDGVVLSGGEAQKIAISRAFARDYKVAVFDEPSSALDPIAEYRLYESMMETCKDKTVIFISHRLSSAILADRVYMLEDGRIVEMGAHKELMAMGGKYADMFTKQAEKYVENNYDLLENII